MVGDEAVHKFAYRIGKQQSRTDDAQLRGIESARVDDGFLHHIQTRAAYIIKAVAQGRRAEGLKPQLPVVLAGLFAVKFFERCRRRYFEVIGKS